MTCSAALGALTLALAGPLVGPDWVTVRVSSSTAAPSLDEYELKTDLEIDLYRAGVRWEAEARVQADRADTCLRRLRARTSTSGPGLPSAPIPARLDKQARYWASVEPWRSLAIASGSLAVGLVLGAILSR